jgi:replication factor C subunit 1
MSLFISGGPVALALDYLPLIREMLIKPLSEYGQEGIQTVTDVLNEYGLTREDWGVITEMKRFSPVDVKSVETNVKAALTREYDNHSFRDCDCLFMSCIVLLLVLFDLVWF